jgi:GntR family transcriptional regulator, rspAB operon transcriptional repressor
MEPKKTTNMTAYNLIIDKIINMEFRPGEIITEVSIAEKLGLSRTPVREALQKLEAEGLITTENRTKRINYLTPHDIENIFDLKIAIESFVVGAAARKGTPGQMDELSNLVIKFQQLGSDYQKGIAEKESFYAEWFETDRKFHNLIFEMADNHRAEQIIEMLNMQWLRIKMGISAMEGRIIKAAVEHEQIGNAIISRNEKDAELAIHIHFGNLKNELILLMRTFNY